jgi:putative endonuclease
MRNFRPSRGGEVDLVCRERGRPELIFVEVKTRSDLEHGWPQEAVDWEKRRRLIQAAEVWLEELEIPGVVARFDIVEIYGEAGTFRLRHLPNAFMASETLHPGSAPSILGANRGDVLPRRAHGGGAPIRPRRVRD